MLRAGRCTVPGKFMAWGGSWVETCWKLNVENVMLSSMFDKVAMYLAYIWPIICFLKMEGASSAKIVWSLRHQKNAFSSSDVALYSRFTFPTKPNIVRFDFLDISRHFVTLRPRFPAATPRITWSRGSTGAAEHEMHMSEPIWNVFRMQDLRSSISKSRRFRNHFWSPQVIEVNQRRVTLGRDEAGRNQKIYRDFVGFQYISYYRPFVWTLLETFKLSSNLEFG